MKLIQDALDVFYSNGLLNIDALLCLQKVYYLEQHVSCLTLNCYDTRISAVRIYTPPVASSHNLCTNSVLI